MNDVEFHPEAGAELLAAARFYEERAHDLGADFIASVEHTCERLQTFPESGRPFGNRLRRVLVPGFPFGVLYRVRNGRITVIGIAHLHRRPGYWRSRT